VDYLIVPTFAEMLDEPRPGKVPWQLHHSGQSKAFVADQMQAKT
jgi:hypothetical protein